MFQLLKKLFSGIGRKTILFQMAHPISEKFALKQY